jgi:hypothetical protein
METSEEYLIVEKHVPHVAHNLKLFWGTEFFVEYVTRLMFDTRDGQRQGFHKEAAKAMTALLARHDEEFPRVIKNDVWDNV